jgi:hypothetical protein
VTTTTTLELDLNIPNPQKRQNAAANEKPPTWVVPSNPHDVSIADLRIAGAPPWVQDQAVASGGEVLVRTSNRVKSPDSYETARPGDTLVMMAPGVIRIERAPPAEPAVINGVTTWKSRKPIKAFQIIFPEDSTKVSDAFPPEIPGWVQGAINRGMIKPQHYDPMVDVFSVSSKNWKLAGRGDWIICHRNGSDIEEVVSDLQFKEKYEPISG